MNASLARKAAAAKGPALETIQPLRAPGATPAEVGALPDLSWIPLASLRINRGYQRDLSRRSIELILKTVTTFDWARLKALSVFDMGDGTFEVMDGQHTAIAAATHGGIPTLPCLVCKARPLEEAAAAFVDLNTNRLSLTPLQVFWAEVAAGDELAQEVVQGVRSGGGHIPRTTPSAANVKEGEVVSVVALKKIAKEGGPAWVKRVVSLGVQARLRPIGRDFIVAFRAILWPATGAPKISDERIVDVLRIHGPKRLQNDARVLKEANGGSIGDNLALVFERMGR